MSATGRGGERRKDDVYYTPAWCVHRLYEHSRRLKMWFRHENSALIEPFAGDGAIIRALIDKGLDRRYPIIVNELREEEQEGLSKLPGVVRVRQGDFRSWNLREEYCLTSMSRLRELEVQQDNLELFSKIGTHIVISNPPYYLAMEAAKWCIENADYSFLLLRLNWLSSRGRRDFLSDAKPDIYILPDRPSFTEDGKTDGTEYAWFEFGSHTSGQITWLDLTTKEEKRKCRVKNKGEDQ